MKITDELDIIILNCNGAGYLEKCIESIKENTEQPYNIIVVDQNSKDGSREWLISEKMSHIILNNKNNGIAYSRNLGIRAGRCDWFALISIDVEIEDKFWLDKMWNYTIDSRIGFVEGMVWNDNDKKNEFAKMNFCLIRKQCFNEVGYFDKRYFTGGDDDWLVRLENSWWKNAFCLDTKINYHCGDSILSVYDADKWGIFQRNSDDTITSQYTESFLNRTLFRNEDRRRVIEESFVD